GPLRAAWPHRADHGRPAALSQRAVARAARGARRGVRARRGRPGDARGRPGRGRRALLLRPRPRHARGAGGPRTAAVSARRAWTSPAVVGPLRRDVAALARPAEADDRAGAG